MASTLKELVETIYLEAQGIDSIFRNKERYMMYRYAKQGMKALGLAFGLNVKGMNVTVPMSCKVYKPSDYQAFIRAYILNCDGRTIEIAVNNKVPDEIHHYLVNCDGSLISDHCGTTLYDDCLVCNESPAPNISCGVCSGSGRYLSDESLEFLEDIKKYSDSWIKEKADYFEFSSDLEEMKIVIEYAANQLNDLSECQIVVHEEMEEALEYYIKYRLLEGGMETMNQAQYYRKMYKNMKEAAMTKQNPLNISDIYKVLAS